MRSEELKGYVKKMHNISTRLIYIICLIFTAMASIVFFLGDDTDEDFPYRILVAVVVLALYLLAFIRPRYDLKKSWQQMEQDFALLDVEQQETLLRAIRTASKDQWKGLFFVTADVVLLLHGTRVLIVPTKEILWVHQHQYTYIPVFKILSLCLYTMNGKSYQCVVATGPLWWGEKWKSYISKVIGGLRSFYPGIISGHNLELATMYRKDLALMRALYQRRAEEYGK